MSIIAAENAVLAMWYTSTHDTNAVKLAEAFGLNVKTTKGFVSVKQNTLANHDVMIVTDGINTAQHELIKTLNLG